MRETNRTKFDRIKAIIDEVEAGWLAGLPEIPKHRFQIHPTGKMAEYRQTAVRYHNRQYYTGRVTGKELVAIAKYAAQIPPFDMANVYVHYEQGKSSGAFRLTEWMKMLDEQAALALSSANAAQTATDTANLEAGTHLRCGYCQKVVPIEQRVKQNIIGRGRDFRGKACVTNVPMEFCSGQCAGYEQMSREG